MMKRIVALFLTLCVLIAALPVFAEAPETPEAESSSWLDELIGSVFDGETSNEDKLEALKRAVNELKEQFSGTPAQLSKILASLKEKLNGLISGVKDKAGPILEKLKDKLKGFSLPDLDGLLGETFSSDDSWTEEDDAELDEMLDQMNRDAEADTGDRVSDKKNAESVEEFYGSWNETRFIYNDSEYDMSGEGEGVFIGEGIYYVTENGEKSEYYLYPETAELSIRDGVLKINSDGHWNTFVLTEDGQIVMCSSTMLVYFTRAE